MPSKAFERYVFEQVLKDRDPSGDQMTIESPEIVNGLQTSHEVFNWYTAKKKSLDANGDSVSSVGSNRCVEDDRRILIKVIVLKDDNSRTRIIKATNSQTKVSDLSLLSTEPIQQTIDDQLQLYGLFYDRKKGQCRRLKRPIARVVGIKSMAQAVIAIALREPDQARGRPEQFVNNNAKKVFDSSGDGDLYAACIIVDRQVKEFLVDSSELTGDQQRDLRYYIGMFLVSMLLESPKPLLEEIASSLPKLRNISKADMQAAC